MAPNHKQYLEPNPAFKVKAKVKDTQEVKDNAEGQMSVTRKLMLSALMFAVEASCDYEQLYTVPVLQTLGMPLRFVSLCGLVGGPISMLLIPAVAWLTDRGSNPQRRRTLAIVGGAGTLLLGLVCILVANLLHLRYLDEYNASRMEFLASQNGTSSNSDVNFVNDVIANVSFLGNFTTPGFSAVGDGTGNESVLGNASTTIVPSFNMYGDSVPFKAGLGMLGFILLDIGYDGVNSFMKFLVLSRTPRAHHTSIIVLGLLVASAGGVATASLGLLRFRELLGIEQYEGGNLTIQTTVQALAVMVFVIIGLVVTLLTSKSQEKRMALQTDSTKTLLPKDQAQYSHRQDALTRSTNLFQDTLEASIRSFGGGASNFDPSLALLDSERRAAAHHVTPHVTEDTPLIGWRQRHHLRHADDVVVENETNIVTKLNNLSAFGDAAENQIIPAFTFTTTPLEHVIEEEENSSERSTENGPAEHTELNNEDKEINDNGGGINGRAGINNRGGINDTRPEINDHRAELKYAEIKTDETQTESQHISPQEDEGDENAKELHANAFLRSGATDATERKEESDDYFADDDDEENLIKDNTAHNDEVKSEVDGQARQKTKAKLKIALVCVSLYLALGAVTMFTMTSSDFIGKVVYKGDPEAPPGSPEQMRYEEGAKQTSWGFFIYYISYMMMGMVQSQVLAFLGKRVEFVLMHVSIAVMMVILAQTELIEVFYVVAIVAGIQRASTFAIPIAVANDVIQSTVTPDGKYLLSPDLTLSFVMMTVPFQYTSIFTWIGPLEAATGIFSLPLYLGAIFGCLASISFLCLGKV